ncbi:tetratricopeptide repeat protein [Hyalangium versicolor]|uniref:tetratricopeptide repeat protein n=1 Tax=Hyalangium versicolor TaxID=2861190 RepID=UPI001CCD8E49|nr:tetratricopeptide repeat protein [Hyalangium versicolor]
MAKSIVERYEQLLLQDPTSAVFVELAKVLLEKGEHARAIEVCQQGLSHHPQSVIGRVLWGKALLHLGKPAQAMEQFDQAIAVDKENPHAYNLIGEVLVQRGLFRSALPILRKASALQPNDGRVKLWLDQTQQALSGGPAPVLADLPGITANELAPKPLEEEQPVAKAAPAAAKAAKAEPAAKAAPAAAKAAPPAPPPEAENDEEPEQAAAPPPPPPAESEGLPPEEDDMGGDDITRQINIFQLQSAPGPAPARSEAQARPEGLTPEGKVKVYMFPPRRGAPPPPPEEEELADTPPPHGGRRAEREEDETPVTMQEAPEERAESSGGLLPDVEAPAGRGLLPDLDGADSDDQDDGEQELPPEPETQVEAPAAKRKGSSGGGLLGDLPLPEEEDELAAVPAAARVSDTARSGKAGRSRGSKSAAKRALLDDIPEAVEPRAAAAPRADTSQVDAEAAAAAYEKELREKIAKSAANPSFFARYGLRIAVSAVVLVVLGVGLGVYRFRRAQQGGQTLAEVLERVERAVSQDTRDSLHDAVGLLDRAQEMDDGSSRVWALVAYTHGLLYADHGGLTEERQMALTALEHPGVRAEFQGLSLSTDVLVADEKARPTAHRALLESPVSDSSELHTLAGSLLLADKKPEKALEHFKRALEISSRNVRALVAIGQYYQDFEDYAGALRVYTTATEISPKHPVARIGRAESQLSLGQDLGEALKDVQELNGDTTLSDELKARQQLVQGRLLTELGRYNEALQLLEAGTKGLLAFEAQLALGDASRASGNLPKAQQAYEAALTLQPKSEAAREGLGRTLLDRDRIKDALDKLAGSEGRRVSLVRAAAYMRQADWKRAKQELEKTRVNNRLVPEAAAYMAVADIQDGTGGDQTRAFLEKAVNDSKQPRPELRLALGRVYWAQSTLDKAQDQFEQAMKDSRDYEIPCALGRLLIARGLPDVGIKLLSQAVERNSFHGEARDALGRALLTMGRTEEGFKQFEEWKKESPDNPDMQKGYAFALLRMGQRQQAAELIRTAKLSPNDSVGQRMKAVILYSVGDSKGGIAALQAAAKTPNPENFCEMAQVFLRQEKKEEAAGAFEKVRTDWPDAPCGLIGEHYVYPEEGGKAAAESLKGVASRASAIWDKAFAQATMARVLLSANNVKAARAAAEEAVKLDPFNGRTQLVLGLVAVRERQVEPAIAALSKAVEYDPANGMAHLALADVLVRKQEELARAVQEYETFLKIAGSAEEAKRVKKALPNLKKRVK